MSAERLSRNFGSGEYGEEMMDSQLEASWFFGAPYSSEKGTYPLDSRQERILIIQDVDILGILSGRANWWLPEEVPSDCRLERVFQDDNNSSMCLVISHRSFVTVPSGNTIPRSRLLVTYPVPAPPPAAEPEVLVPRPAEDTLDNREV